MCQLWLKSFHPRSVRECRASWVLSFGRKQLAVKATAELQQQLEDHWVKFEEGAAEFRVRISKHSGRKLTYQSHSLQDPFSTSTLPTW